MQTLEKNQVRLQALREKTEDKLRERLGKFDEKLKEMLNRFIGVSYFVLFSSLKPVKLARNRAELFPSCKKKTSILIKAFITLIFLSGRVQDGRVDQIENGKTRRHLQTE